MEECRHYATRVEAERLFCDKVKNKMENGVCDFTHSVFGCKFLFLQEIILRHIQVVVFTVLGKKLVVIALFHNAALIHIHDAVGIFDGGKSVGDDEGGSVFQKLV